MYTDVRYQGMWKINGWGEMDQNAIHHIILTSQSQIKNLWLHLQYRLRRTLHYFELTRTHYERTEYARLGVRALMEIIGARIPNGHANNFLDVIIRARIE